MDEHICSPRRPAVSERDGVATVLVPAVYAVPRGCPWRCAALCVLASSAPADASSMALVPFVDRRGLRSPRPGLPTSSRLAPCSCHASHSCSCACACACACACSCSCPCPCPCPCSCLLPPSVCSAQSLESGASTPSVMSISLALDDRKPNRIALFELAFPCRPRANTPWPMTAVHQNRPKRT